MGGSRGLVCAASDSVVGSMNVHGPLAHSGSISG